MDSLLEKQSKIDNEIDITISQKAIAPTDDEKYLAKIEEYKKIINHVDELEIKKRNNEYILLLVEIKKTLAIDELKPELLIKQIADDFIAKVIIISREEIFISLHGKNQIDSKFIKKIKTPFIKQDSILIVEVVLARPFTA